MDARSHRYGRSTRRRPGRHLVAVLAVLGSVLCLGTGTASAASLGCDDNSAGTTDLSAWVPEMLAATNAHRTGMGLVALQLDPTLTKAATWKSRDLARRNYFDHADMAQGDAPSRSPWDRLAACGWTQGGNRAENIAAGQESCADYITAWLNSPGHRTNIENASMRYVGFGVASSTSSDYGTYATQMFASVPGPAGVTMPAPPVAPAAPTITALTFAADGAAKLVCPALGAAAGTTFVEDSVGSGLDVSRTAAGCLRIAPAAGVAGFAAAVTYHAAGSTGLASAKVTMQVTVEDAPRTPFGGGGSDDGSTDSTPAPATRAPSVLRSATSTVTHRRCRGAGAVAGWCWAITTRGQLVAADGTSLAGQRVTVSRRTATGRYVLVGTAVTNGAGSFTLVRALRPSSHATGRWVRTNAGTLRVAYAGAGTSGAATRAVTSRIA
ncbi:MAG: SCP-like extracellular [Thermoleophilia bacterium]|nr:SCP-like extracellular [Thermoleophilia bacterium]